MRLLLKFALFNLLIVASTGLLLRGVVIYPFYPLSLENLLHGHSHFALGAWVTPLLLWALSFYFPEIRYGIAFRQWRTIVWPLIISGYGMLIAFPLQGYGGISILFSTVSILATCYFSVLVWRVLGTRKDVHALLLKASIVFLLVSSAGPFATGPLAVYGFKGTHLYYNAVYLYLHFQFNGWFLFAILAMMYRHANGNCTERYARPGLGLALTGCVLSLFLSFLWTKPDSMYYIIGGVGALHQVAGVIMLLRSTDNAGEKPFAMRLKTIAITAILLKCMLQVASAVPWLAEIAYLQRSLLVAYLHLFMLGIVTTFGFLTMYRAGLRKPSFRVPVSIFLTFFIITEAGLVLQGLKDYTAIHILNLPGWMFFLSIPFPLSVLWLVIANAKYLARSANPAEYSSNRAQPPKDGVRLRDPQDSGCFPHLRRQTLRPPLQSA